MLDGALALARLGFRVFPCVPDGKVPATKNGFHDATSDPNEIVNRWWGKPRYANYNVGVATGWTDDQSSCVFVIDLDTHDERANGLREWEAFVEDYDAPYTATVFTPSGGQHLYFRSPVEVTNGAGSNFPAGIDVRGHGGYVIAPPSIVDGKPYLWEDSLDPTDGGAIEWAPGWLQYIVTKEPPRQVPRKSTSPRVGERPGDLWMASVTWPELLEAHGATYIRTRTYKDGSTYELWARPGCLTKHRRLMVGATLYFMGSDVLKVHTSNWPNLVEGGTYNRFGFLAATRFGGDYSAATKWCVEQGFSSNRTVKLPDDTVRGPSSAELLAALERQGAPGVGTR